MGVKDRRTTMSAPRHFTPNRVIFGKQIIKSGRHHADMKLTASTRAKNIVVVLLAALALLTLAACASPEPQVIEREIIREVEVVKEVEVEVQVVVTATPAPQPTAAPTPMPTSTPAPSPTPETSMPVAAAPTPAPVVLRPPTATPKPTYTIDDYYVIINQGSKANSGEGLISLYNRPRYIESGDGKELLFFDEDLFMNYLLSEGVITSEQKSAYYTPVSAERLDDYRYDRVKFLDEDFVGNTKIPLRPFANSLLKLHYLTQNKKSPFSKIVPSGVFEDHFLRYADKDLLNPDRYNIPSEETGYVVIRDGSIAVSGTSEDGVTTSVSIDTVDTGELLDYLLSQNKITVAQRDEYGRTGELELSLADTPDFFDWAISSDEGVQVGINEEGIDYIRNNILPLFGE